MQLPTIKSYGKYSSDNYGVNSLMVSLGDLELYYSYQTIVAFRCSHLPEGFRTFNTIKNQWRQTTGKHLNWIDGGKEGRKDLRLDPKRFEEGLRIALKAHKVDDTLDSSI